MAFLWTLPVRDMMNKGTRHNGLSAKDGVALISALGLLMVFAVLGTAYVRFMTIEYDRTKYIVQEARGRALAQGGINATIGEIQQALKDGVTPNGVYDFELPIFLRDGQGMREEKQAVRVRVSDETARVNINHAPAGLLRAMGFKQSSIKSLAALGSTTSKSNQGKRNTRTGPLASVSELRTRNIVGSRDFHGLNTDLMTVYTGSGRTNINSASPKVLAAIFGIELEDARVLARQRPFTSWANAVQKVGSNPSTFNVDASSDSLPRELSLTSNCYRLISEATVRSQGRRQRGVRGVVEAVVIFMDDGTTNIRFWSEVPVERLDTLVVGEEVAEDTPKESDDDEEELEESDEASDEA